MKIKTTILLAILSVAGLQNTFGEGVRRIQPLEIRWITESYMNDQRIALSEVRAKYSTDDEIASNAVRSMYHPPNSPIVKTKLFLFTGFKSTYNQFLQGKNIQSIRVYSGDQLIQEEGCDISCGIYVPQLEVSSGQQVTTLLEGKIRLDFVDDQGKVVYSRALTLETLD